VLAGRLKSADQQRVVFHDDLEGTLTEADAWYDKFRQQIDEYANKCDPPLPAGRVKPTSSKSEHGKRSGVLELRNEDISSVVWATGYTCDFSWIKLPVLDGNGDPIHERGVTKRTGLFFLGLRRTYSLGSALVAGAVNDATYIEDATSIGGSTSLAIGTRRLRPCLQM
jgi:putative flavoprotein involved in K+ transport